MSNELYFAILLEDMCLDEIDMPVFMAVRPIVGFLDKENQVFRDVLSNREFINIDVAYAMGLPEGFNFATSLRTFKGSVFGKFPGEKIREEWYKYEKHVYFYDDVVGQLMACTEKEFEDKYGVKLNLLYNEELNSLTASLIHSNITAEEYYDTLYGGTHKSEMSENASGKEKSDKRIAHSERITDLVSNIQKRVISQDEAVKKLALSIYKRNEGIKSNILICGPTGCGKTELVRSLASAIDVPVLITDMTKFTEAGYEGASVDDILFSLIENARDDMKRAEKSILFLDEIDKKATKRSRYSFNKGDVLKSLLKIIEGGIVDIKRPCGQIIHFDTSNLIVIAGGAFSELYKESVKANLVGFDRENVMTKEFKAKDITIKDLEKYGMPIEFLGRFNTVIRMNELHVEDLVKILKTSESNILRKYERVFASRGINLVMPPSIYEKIAERAYSYKTGARALNMVVEQIFDEILYEIFDTEDKLESVVLGEDIVDNKNSFSLKRGI